MRVVCLGSGPSLTQEDVESCFALFTIAINNSVELAPWADVLFAADYTWWDRHHGVPWFLHRKVGCYPFGQRYPEVQRLTPSGVTGLEMDPTKIRTGKNSGYGAINYAVHCGATEILLLGYDMGPTGGRHHWHAPHTEGDPHPSYDACLPRFDTLVEPLRNLGISVYNCSRSTRLTAFPTRSLREVLDAPVAGLPLLRESRDAGDPVPGMGRLPS